MTSDPPDLGKGLFGYRKSAVNQILADRDIMLRQAEGRVRAAESKVADLQNELTSMKERSTRMDEQVERLRAQLEALVAGAPAPFPAEPKAPAVPPTVAPAQMESSPPVPEPAQAWDVSPAPWEQDFGEPAAAALSYGESGGEHAYDEFAEADASFEGLDSAPGSAQLQPHQDMPQVFERTGDPSAAATDSSHLFGEQDHLGQHHDEEPSIDLTYEASPPEGDRGLPAWVDATPPPAEPMRKVDEMMYQPADEQPQSPSPPQGGDDDGYSSVPYGFSLQPAASDESETHPDFSEQPVFRGFTEETFEEPKPSDYMGNAAAQTTPPNTVPSSPEWAGDGTQTWASQAFQPSQTPPPVEWNAPPPPTAAPTPPPAPPEQPGISAQSSDLTNRFVTEELKGILAAAEESATRILERARVTSEHQIAQSNRLWREVQAELARFSSWREQVEPIIRSVHAKVEGVRSQIEEVPEKIRQALAPMADSISMIDSDLAELASASVPPLLLTPSGLDPGSPVNDWPIGETGSGPGERPEQDRGEEGTGHLAG